MSPAEFFGEIALPTALDFRAQQRSRRLAYLACITAFHVKDHLAKAGEARIEAAMRARAGDAFDLVRGVCNGSKHVQTDASHLIAFTAGADRDRPQAFLGRFRLGSSFFGDIKGGRAVAVGGGARTIYPAVASVLRAYTAEYPGHLLGCDISGL